MNLDALHSRWQQTCAPLHAEIDAVQAVWHTIRTRYGEPHRAYHGLAHLEQLFEVFDGVSILAEQALRCELALWMHDIIYEPMASDNEAKSARLARGLLATLGADAATIDWVAQTILATQPHTATGDPDRDLVIDVDMSILGTDPSTFTRYQAQIRQEYPDVPDAIFDEHRRRFLANTLQAPQLFHTQALRRRYEARARQNLRAALGLGDSGPANV